MGMPLGVMSAYFATAWLMGAKNIRAYGLLPRDWERAEDKNQALALG
ncbi:MAG: hypothetical protein AB8B96_09510 [Lysobacterales bacterium]